MRTICIIQARVNSTRLPNKVFLALAGKSMLQNVIERVKRAKLIDGIIVATPRDDCWYLIHQEVMSEPTNVIVMAPDRPEEDLIGRYLFVAQAAKADFIIRVCADNPCVEPGAIDYLISKVDLLESRCRLLYMNSENVWQDYDGFGGEIYSLEMLEWMDRTIKDPIYREHPHKFWVEINSCHYIGNKYPPGFRLDVNTPADYKKLRDIYNHFGHNRFTVKEVMEYLGTKNLEKRPVPA